MKFKLMVALLIMAFSAGASATAKIDEGGSIPKKGDWIMNHFFVESVLIDSDGYTVEAFSLYVGCREIRFDQSNDVVSNDPNPNGCEE